MNIFTVSKAEYRGLLSSQSGQQSLSFAAQRAGDNLGPEGSARFSCIAACTAPHERDADNGRLYLHDSSGNCHMLPLPDYDAWGTEDNTKAPTARLQAQPSSRVWPSCSGSFVAAEVHTQEGPALRLKDLATGRQSQVSLQVLLNEVLVRAWVSDNGKAVLVLSSIHGQQHLHLLLRQEGHPDSSLPQQPVARWVQLSDVPSQPSESRDTGTPTGSQNVDSAIASAAPGQSSVTVLGATFVQSASGLMCCIAAAEHESEHGHQLQVYSLLQPVTQAAQAIRSWQKSTIRFGGASGGSSRETTQEAGTAASAGSVASGVQLPLHAMTSFEDLDLSQTDAVGCAKIGPPSSPRSAPSLLLCWQPENFSNSGGPSIPSGHLAVALSDGLSGSWLALLRAHADSPATLLRQVSWSADGLAHAERPATSPSTAIGDPYFAGLSWLPGGDALAVLGSLGHLAICDMKGDLPAAARADSSSKIFMQAEVQLSVGAVMGLPGWAPGDAAAVSTPHSSAMCAYRPADRSSARLAILRGSELTVLAVDGRPNTAAASQANTLHGTLGTAEAAAGEEYIDITPAIGALERPQPLVKQSKQKRTPRLGALAACVSPPPVKEDERRPDHKEEQLRAQKQHSLPETSPGKSPAGSGAFTPFRGLSALRARLGSPLGSPLQHASPSQAASPSSSSHRDHPEDLSSDHVHQSVHASSLRAAESSPDGSEQATHVDGASRGADDTRRVSFADVSKVMHEQNRASHYPPSPHPIKMLGPQGAAQQGSPGSLHLVHAPKKSALRPRGSRAPTSWEDEDSQASPASVTESPHALPLQHQPDTLSVYHGTHHSKAALEAGNRFQHSSASTARSQLAWAGSAASVESAVTPRHAFQQEPARAGAQLVSVGRSRSGRGEPEQDAPRIKGSPGALQAKLQRLKARWSALAEHGHSPQAAPTKPAKGASLGSEQNRVTLSVSAGAPFTVFKLDDEEASEPSTFPPGDGRGTPGVGQTAPSGAEETRGQQAGQPDEPASPSDVGHAQPAHEQLMSMLAGPGWEQQLGLPAGVDLWGPTVLEVPESPRASAILAAACPSLPAQRAARSKSSNSSGVIFVTEPGPIAESVEGQDVQCDVCEELDRSLSTSSSSQSKAMLPARAPDPSIEFQSKALAMSQGSEDSLAQSKGTSLHPSHGSDSASALPEGQGDEESEGSDACLTRLPGKVLCEGQSTTLTSPSLTDTTQTFDVPASVSSLSQTEPRSRQGAHGHRADQSPEPCKEDLGKGQGQEDPVLKFADEHEQGGRAAATSQPDESSLTLDQRLSSDVSGYNKAGQHSHAAAGVQPHRAAMHAVAMQDSLPMGKAGEYSAGMTAHAGAAQAGSPEEGGAAQASLNCRSKAAASEQVEGVHSMGLVPGAKSEAEPVMLDRGEPTFEDRMRQQTVQSNTIIPNSWKAGQLLPHRKQTPQQQPAHGPGSPQRSVSPFARIMQAGKVKPEGARPEPPTGLSRLLSMAGRQNEGAALEQRPTLSFGPGPLETGWHEAERGGYYLTTPDPLRQDPGFAVRRRQTTSEHSAQSAAQHAQHGRDPLNWDPVQYESSPVWRKNTLTALESLHPYELSDAGPYPRQQPHRPEGEASAQMARSAAPADALQGAKSKPEQPTHITQKHTREAMHAKHRARSSEPPTIRHTHKEDSISSAADGMQRGKPRIQDRTGERRQQGKSRRQSGDSLRSLRPWRAETQHCSQQDASAASLPVSGNASGAQGTGTESEPIPAFRGYGGARLMRSELDSGPPAGDNPWSHDHSLRLVDTDCKWGLNRAGRPPDPFWEVCGRSVPRKILTSHDKIRLLRVELDERPRQAVLRSACTGRRQHSIRSMRSGPESPRSVAEGKGAKKSTEGDKRMLRELKEIAAALKEMKSSRGVSPRNAGKPEHAKDDPETPLASRQAAHAEQDFGAARCSQQDTARAEHWNAAACSGSVMPSHPHKGGNQQATESGTEQSRHEHSGQRAEGFGHSLRRDEQAGQAVAKQGRHKAAVDKGVQAAPTAHRVPVQAVLLTPTAPAHQGLYADQAWQPTELERDALQKLRDGLSTARGGPLRAFTSVKDVFKDVHSDAPQGAAKSCTSPSRKKQIHPSTPEGASWGSRHAQHIGRKSDNRGKAGGRKDRKDTAATDKDLRAMALQLQHVVASLNDVEALATAVRKDAATSSKMVKKLHKEPNAKTGPL